MTAAKERRSGTEISLAAALRRPECYPHPVRKVRMLETHISWVALTGSYAYKVKKPVDLGFVDFSTLERRRHYCEEELRLNRRLAPELYLEVVPIRGNAGAVHIGGDDGPVLDYAVKMREFPQKSLGSRVLAGGALGAREIDLLATTIARFHAGAPAAAGGSHLGSPESALRAALQNFDQILENGPGTRGELTLRALRLWTLREHARRRDAMQSRQSDGFVRECHGDLHLGNIAVLDGRPLPFDCIEFNEAFRWIDVMSEIAFLVMDLEDRGSGALGWRFLNRYLEETGDYAGVEVLRFYLVYRALVRAKVHLVRSRQQRVGGREKTRLTRAFRTYLRLAQHYALPSRGGVIITHGLSGSGKSTAAQALVERLGAIRIRSDVERKRLHGIAALARSESAPGEGIYTAAATAGTYRRLGQLARSALINGFPVIVDAAFLKRTEREAFRAIAEESGVPFLILDFHVPLAQLRARIESRAALQNDASEADRAVLERQLVDSEPLTPAEMEAAIVVDGTLAPGGALYRQLLGKMTVSI